MGLGSAIIVVFLSARISHGYTEGSVRQRGFGYYNRLEIYHNGKWGPICFEEDRWNQENTKIACRMLDHENGVSDSYRNFLSKKALLRGVECTGNERNIEDCYHEGWGKYNCSRVVGIHCYGQSSSTACSGRVCEDFHNKCCTDIWGFSFCCRGPTTTTSTRTTTTSNQHKHSHDWVISFRWWWITVFIVIGVVLASIGLRLAKYCRERRLITQSHADGRRDLTFSSGVIHRASILPHDLPPSYSNFSKVSRPAAANEKQNPAFHQGEPEPPPPPYSSVEA